MLLFEPISAIVVLREVGPFLKSYHIFNTCVHTHIHVMHCCLQTLDLACRRVSVMFLVPVLAPSGRDWSTLCRDCSVLTSTTSHPPPPTSPCSHSGRRDPSLVSERASRLGWSDQLSVVHVLRQSLLVSAPIRCPSQGDCLYGELHSLDEAAALWNQCKLWTGSQWVL